jgi:hypothetical protein
MNGDCLKEAGTMEGTKSHPETQGLGKRKSLATPFLSPSSLLPITSIDWVQKPGNTPENLLFTDQFFKAQARVEKGAAESERQQAKKMVR